MAIIKLENYQRMIFETMMQANALSVKELNQRVVDETLHELATKDFVRAEIAEVRAEIADLKVKGLYWLIGTAFVSVATTIGAVFTMMTYMLDRLT